MLPKTDRETSRITELLQVKSKKQILEFIYSESLGEITKDVEAYIETKEAKKNLESKEFQRAFIYLLSSLLFRYQSDQRRNISFKPKFYDHISRLIRSSINKHSNEWAI